VSCVRAWLSVILFLSMCALAESSPQLLDELSQRLTIGAGLEGEFKQEKHLAFLNSPFISSGHFSLDHLKGLRWQVVEPLESLMLVEDGSVELNGSPVRDHGIGRLMAMIMLGLMDGKLTNLNKYFDVTGELSADNWSISLEPHSARLQLALEHIDLRGDQYLREIEIFEHGDNRTVILFTEVRQTYSGESAPDAASTQ
jgi:hypothetical protein